MHLRSLGVRQAQRRWTLRTDDDLVLRLNDVTMAEDNRVADAYPHTMMTTAQLDVLTVAGDRDLDGLEQLQRRLDEMPGRRARRVRPARRRAEPGAALGYLGLSWVCAPRTPAVSEPDAPGWVGHDHGSGSGGPSCAPALGDLTVHRGHLGRGHLERRLS
jgi:hypothetical protein